MGTVRVRQTVIDKSQPEEIYQVVGFSEYDNALHHLDRFVSLSLPEELEVVDEILATRDEFSIYVNLSRRFDTGDSSLDQQPLHPRDDFKRQGLAWVPGQRPWLSCAPQFHRFGRRRWGQVW